MDVVPQLAVLKSQDEVAVQQVRQRLPLVLFRQVNLVGGGDPTEIGDLVDGEWGETLA